MKTTADILDNLFDHLSDDRWDLAELIFDVAELGAEINHPDTKFLMQQLFASMPECDNLTLLRISEHIRQVGTPFATTVAHDLMTMAD